MSRSLNGLPVELLAHIFKNLTIKELDNCRLVCRQFMLICDQLRIPELIYWGVSEAYASRKDFWFFTNQSFNYKNTINDYYEIRAKHRWTFRLEKSLKRLFYRGGAESNYFWSRLNYLTQLVQLQIEINEFCFDGRMPIYEVNLPNLERLDIGQGYARQCVLLFTTPKLSALRCFEFEAIHLSHPNTIEHLELVRYTETADQLVNVKYLKVDWNLIRHRNIWSIFRNLQTLVCNSFDDDSADDFHESIQDVRDLFFRKKPEQRIYFQSVELVHRFTIDEYDTSRNVLAFQMRNYGSLCANILHHGALDYNELMRLTNDNLPADFFRKYFNVRAVEVVGEVNHPQHLLWFMKRFEYLNLLEIDSSFLSQEFYDQLYELDQLTRIIVENNSSIISHDVLLKFPLLKEFSTDQSDERFLDLAVGIFSGQKFFAQMSFNVRGERIYISKVWQCEMHYFSRARLEGTENDGSEPLQYPKSLMSLDDLEHVINRYKIYLSTGEFQYRHGLN